MSSAVFDPFGDYETRGYLRNFEGLKRMDEVKVLEHTFFEANLEGRTEELLRGRWSDLWR